MARPSGDLALPICGSTEWFGVATPLALRLKGEDSECAAACGTCRSRDPMRTCSDLAGAVVDGAASRDEEEEAAPAQTAAPPLADASIVVLLTMDEVAEKTECVVL